MANIYLSDGDLDFKHSFLFINYVYVVKITVRLKSTEACLVPYCRGKIKISKYQGHCNLVKFVKLYYRM